MRNRLIIVFLIPLAGLLLVLGGAYATSASRGIQQEFYATQLGDLGYFLTSARQALLSGNSTVISSESERYEQLYGTRVLVVDRSGAQWPSSAVDPILLEESVAAQIGLALSGRRGEMPNAVLPWSFSETVMVEPVFDDSDVIGAVVLVSSTDVARLRIITQWVTLAIVSIVATAVGILVVFRLANWVLKPISRVDHAMEAIEKGDMEARIADDTGPPELQRVIGMFNRMADEIERVVSRQQEFVLNASHELRNPLSALLVRVEYLATGLDHDWNTDIEETREEGRRMTRILDTLLRLARSGHDGSHRAPVDAARLAQGRVEVWRDIAAQKDIAFDVAGDQHLVVTDKTAVEGALDAVIDNAVKFSPPHTRIEVTTDAGDDGCRITVRDHGPGLSADEVAHAAERFWRSTGYQNTPGAGLGLAIATDLLASADGRLNIVAPADGGLMVTLHLAEEASA